MDDLNPITGNQYTDGYYKIKKNIDSLPTSDPKIKKQIFNSIENNDITILESGTGRGKSVNIPQMLMKEYLIKKKDKRIIDLYGIIVTQPRTANTQGIATYVSNIMDVALGDEVGYRYSDRNVVSSKTKLIYITDGLFLQEIYSNKGYFGYDLIIIDEVHERSINIDTILYLIKNYFDSGFYKTKQDTVLSKRVEYSPEDMNTLTGKKKGGTKFLIMSATFDIKQVEKYFSKSTTVETISVPGASHYPVEQIFLEKSLYSSVHGPPADYINKAIEIIKSIVKSQKSGEIIFFVESKKKAGKVCNEISKYFAKSELFCTQVFRGISEKQKTLAISSELYKTTEGNPKRKLVVGTNFLETGVTIDGIVFVIDSGFEYLNNFINRVYSLDLNFISKNSVKQRLGRAGRVQPGVCYHLYTKEEYNKMNDFRPPEITRANIDSTLLQLMRSNILTRLSDIKLFMESIITRPHVSTLQQSLKYLFQLGLITIGCSEFSTKTTKKNTKKNTKNTKIVSSKTDDPICLTFLGNCIASLGLNPSLGMALLSSYHYGSMDDVLTIVSMISTESSIGVWFPESQKRKIDNEKIDRYKNENGEIISLLKLYQDFYGAYDKQTWAKENSLDIQLFYSVQAERNKLEKRLENIGKSCRIRNVFKSTGTKYDGIINSFLVGVCNQLCIRKKQDEYMTIDPTGFSKVIINGKTNPLMSKVGNIVAYISKERHSGKNNLGILIDVSKHKLEEINCFH